ncbi:hypothetical protein H4R18_004154 [Coemansia javaensis]|uniref:Uncharacterized protein n=1 Tax=Coemansia javaensis TaxID=2761396 RepID=A0A9W8HA88_9FUNG|nr:hypothetical protein H4R18_004154 [Coemansia javaensis]
MEPSDVVLLILGVVCPPGSAALKRGLSRDFIVCVALTLLFWLPGVAYSWYLIFKYPLENFWRQGVAAGQYHSIEEGLRRHSLAGATTSAADDEDDPARHSDEAPARGTAAPASPHPAQAQGSRSGRGRRPRRTRNGSGGARRPTPSALQEAARNYALRHQQRQEANAVKQWFVDRFYFSDPTQVPPSPEQTPSELRNLDSPR